MNATQIQLAIDSGIAQERVRALASSNKAQALKEAQQFRNRCATEGLNSDVTIWDMLLLAIAKVPDVIPVEAVVAAVTDPEVVEEQKELVQAEALEAELSAKISKRQKSKVEPVTTPPLLDQDKGEPITPST